MAALLDDVSDVRPTAASPAAALATAPVHEATGAALPTTTLRAPDPALRKRGGAPRWLYLAALVLACALPLLMSEYRLFQATMTLVYAMVLLGLTVLTGYSGQISLGHGAFYAVGAYTTAILITHFGVPYYLTLPVSALICLVVGFLFGRPALRLEGHYLALATFALAVVLPPLLKHKQLQAWTGGVQGILFDKPSAPFGLPISADAWIYWFTLAVSVLLFVLVHNLLKGRVGRALLAIKDQPTAAAAMGVNTSLYKSLAFAVSALCTGVAGSLGAIAVQFVAPDSFYPLLSIMFLVGAVIGGLGSLWGALFGAMFIQFVPNVTEDISKSASWAIYGVLMLVSVFFMGDGITGALQRAWRRIRRRSSPAAVPTEPRH